MKTLVRWSIVFGVLVPLGACNAGSRCLRTSDCPTGYQCGAGVCELRTPPASDAGFDADANDAARAGSGIL